MSAFREQLIQDYAAHYQRVGTGADRPAEISPAAMAGLELTFGELLTPLGPHSRVLDLGCGTGSLLHWLATHDGIEPAGVDLSPSQIAIAQSALPDLDIVCGDGLDYLREHPGAFAGMFCFDLLEHIPSRDDYPEWFEAIRGALTPGGFFCCRVPNAANLTGTYSRYMDLTHERIFTRTSLLQLLDSGGLHEARVVPIRRPTWTGRVRLTAERLVHRAVFRLCGRGLETVFTSNVCAVGYAPPVE